MSDRITKRQKNVGQKNASATVFLALRVCQMASFFFAFAKAFRANSKSSLV